jgi:hypothetical protein
MGVQEEANAPPPNIFQHKNNFFLLLSWRGATEKRGVFSHRLHWWCKDRKKH